MNDKETDTIPSMATCYEMMEAYGMLSNIREHSDRVMRVALAICDNLSAGTAIDRELVMAGALLHDIRKTRSLQTRESHDITGGELLRGLGYRRVAFIVEQHVIFRNFDPAGPLREDEIVYYADKRVMHHHIVSVDERIEDLVVRYGSTPERVERILKNRDFVLSIENKINSHLSRDLHEVLGSITGCL